MTPPISVLMAVHNGQAFLAEAVKSVCGQSLSDFEFIIVDDASNDETPAMLAAAAAREPRIRLVRNDENLGLTRSLNKGLRQAQGRYVARIDADDVCLPHRLERQFAFMETHPGHVAVACGYHVIDEGGRLVRTHSEALDDWKIRWLGGFNPPAPHPTYFFRRTEGDGAPFLYDESFETAQDFDLWSRMRAHGMTQVLADVLIKYRRHAGAITFAKRKVQAASCKRTGLRNLEHRLPPETVKALAPLVALFAYEARADHATITAAVKGCDAMLAHDRGSAPTAGHYRWARRKTAGLLADAVLSRAGGLYSAPSLAAFACYARDYLPALFSATMAQPGLAVKSLRSAARV